ncbi:PHD and RING finger domain protein [Aspergillus luchuensis]|uniref:PHD and RING finger domain protein n=1 Tax=Aspergillus kawachii TaxID=1069201 RepID=A0A146G373_ASPKA|nr:PHD and RING finger domain protein [Aspergillus luchuensis]
MAKEGPWVTNAGGDPLGLRGLGRRLENADWLRQTAVARSEPPD